MSMSLQENTLAHSMGAFIQQAKLLLLCFTLCITPILNGCANFRPGFISEESYKVDGVDEPLGGHFEGEEWMPDNPNIGLTYKIPDISAGFIFDANGYKVTPVVQVELLEFNLPIPYLGTWKLDAGVGYQRTYGYVGPLLTNIFEISVGGFVGWNWEEEDLSYGVGFTIIKF